MYVFMYVVIDMLISWLLLFWYLYVVCVCSYLGDIFSCHAVDNPDLESEKVN